MIVGSQAKHSGNTQDFVFWEGGWRIDFSPDREKFHRQAMQNTF